MEAIVLSRTDTFKEHIIRAYVAKEEELEHYKKKCQEMEVNDALFKSYRQNNEDLQSKNMKLRDELEDVREKSVMESITLRKNISKQTSKNTEDVKSLQAMTEKSKNATGSLNQAEEELKKVKA